MVPEENHAALSIPIGVLGIELILVNDKGATTKRWTLASAQTAVDAQDK